jgi:riboflavin biosynthesis pyrimidine reductase
MGLLRASADAVLVGAGTVEAVPPNHVWVAEFICPAANTAYARYRNEVIRKPSPYPLTVIVSGSAVIEERCDHKVGLILLLSCVLAFWEWNVLGLCNPKTV